MTTVYISQQGCYLSLKQNLLLVSKNKEVISEVQLPLIEQILIFGKSQVTTQLIRACLSYNIPIAYLSRMGYCYGRLIALERGYRQLSRYQQQISFPEKLVVAKQLIKAKLSNSKTILRRQQKSKDSLNLSQNINIINYLIEQVKSAETLDKIFGYEGAGASAYFSGFGECITNPDFIFYARSRRPPLNPVNALLSFGYQVLWNHLLALIELQGLDPYSACLHQGSQRHAALASDLIEEFRSPIIDSLVLYIINRKFVSAKDDFTYKNGGCYLNNDGRKKFLANFLQRMEELINTGKEEKQPRWDLLMRQVKRYKDFVYNPINGYEPYLIR
jgi:CRISPR-associated protein Cas1